MKQEFQYPAMSTHPVTQRPRQLAVLLLASGESLPRQRARDQQADRAGSQLKQRVLRRIIEMDPDPDNLLQALEQIVTEFGEPTGPTRAMAQLVFEEFVAACENTRLTAWLLDEATRRSK